MTITFIRHSKVNFKWKATYNSKTFNLACSEYDCSSVKASSKIKAAEKIVYISNQIRSIETANNLLIGEKIIIKTDLLNEIPLCSFVKTNIQIPTILWMMLGRLQWYFNHSMQKEIKKESKVRINAFLNHIQKKQQDCIVIGHGFYFAQMVTEMKKREYTGKMSRRIKNDEIRKFNYDVSKLYKR